VIGVEMRAFMLEDDPVRGGHIRDLLHQHGYNVTWATNFEEAQEAWLQSERPFDLALLDHDLGRPSLFGTGKMFARWVVEQPNVCCTHFVVHSANTVAAPQMVAILVDAKCRVARVWPDSIGIYLKMLKHAS